MPELEGFTYRFEPGAPDRTLLLLHGTGADENDLLPLGRLLDEGAAMLSPRGRVLENGMPRFFRRFADGVLDIEDLKARTQELASFIERALREHGLAKDNVIAIGYSNGANIAASMLLSRPSALRAAVLFRPMYLYEPESDLALGGLPIFIASGRRDPLIPVEEPERLAGILRDAGADVTLEWSDGGHPLERREVDTARAWLARVSS
jgi:predicted esterase